MDHWRGSIVACVLGCVKGPSAPASGPWGLARLCGFEQILRVLRSFRQLKFLARGAVLVRAAVVVRAAVLLFAVLAASGTTVTAGSLGASTSPQPLATQRRLILSLPVVSQLSGGSRVPAPRSVALGPVGQQELLAGVKVGGPALGSLSFGRANRGALFNGVKFPDGPFWEVMEPARAFGTAETVAALQNGITEVNRLYPDSPLLYVGHLSRQSGGWLRPHRSHQSGRDVDLGLYYQGGPAWYRPATADNLDVVRTWALMSALLKTTEVEYIFLSGTLHDVLEAEARRIGEDPTFVRDVFQGQAPHSKPILRHARGHQTHLHVRFASPIAVGDGRRAARALGRLGRSSAAAARTLRLRSRASR